jgi:hypothetical protein
MASDFQRGVLEVLNHVRTWNMTHFASVAAFLRFGEDKLSLPSLFLAGRERDDCDAMWLASLGELLFCCLLFFSFPF